MRKRFVVSRSEAAVQAAITEARKKNYGISECHATVIRPDEVTLCATFIDKPSLHQAMLKMNVCSVDEKSLQLSFDVPIRY